MHYLFHFGIYSMSHNQQWATTDGAYTHTHTPGGEFEMKAKLQDQSKRRTEFITFQTTDL